MRPRAPTGHYHLEGGKNQSLTGVGDPDHIRLRDEHGNVWFGSAEMQDDESIRYRFRDQNGNMISGISDRFGIVLRDEKGKTWRGYVY